MQQPVLTVFALEQQQSSMHGSSNNFPILITPLQFLSNSSWRLQRAKASLACASQ
jgi:hypothetical protein